MNLTIAIPVFERYNFFEQTINCVLNQTVKCDLFVVDNGSATTKFQEYCQNNNIKYFRNDKNYGVWYNWNKCFEYAKTEFVMILGDDDLIELTYVEEFEKALEKHNDIDVYYTDFKLLNDYNSYKAIIKDNHFKMPYGYQKTGIEICRYAAEYQLGFPTISCVIKKNVFTGFFTGYHASSDWLWVYQHIDQLTVYGNDKKLSLYRKHDFADTSNNDTQARCFLSHFYIYHKVLPEKVKNERLAKKSVRYSYRQLMRLNLFYRDFLKNAISLDNIYSNYLREVKETDSYLKSSGFLVSQFFFALELKVRTFLKKHR